MHIRFAMFEPFNPCVLNDDIYANRGNKTLCYDFAIDNILGKLSNSNHKLKYEV